MGSLPVEEVKRIVQVALAEDVGTGDVTTLATIPEDALAKAVMVAREPLVVAGSALAIEAFRQISAEINCQVKAQDGESLQRGNVIMEVSGPAGGILTGERVALNFVQRLSGIATLTRKFAEKIAGTKAKILDTRKTTPGLRIMEKYAVVCGGGQNHRIGLYDQVLIKDNHLAAIEPPQQILKAVQRARQLFPNLKVEVEADRLEQAREAAEAGVDIILLDNMSFDQLREAVKVIGSRSKTEASGGVNLDTARSIAESGVDFISVGAITHSARAVDIALDFIG